MTYYCPMGIRKQYEKLYNQYVDKIYRFIYIKIGHKETSQDLTHQVFLKAWQRFKKQGENDNRPKIENPQAYFYQIARNEINNYYRQLPVQKIVSLEEIKTEIRDPDPIAEEKLINSLDLETLRKALLALPEDYQNVVILHYLENYSFREIGKILEKEEGTVRVMAFRGLQKLKEKLLNNHISS